MTVDPNVSVSDSRLRRVTRLALKECRDSLRDRRTVLTLFLMPLLLYPLLAIGFQQFLLSQALNAPPEEYRIAITGVEDKGFLLRLLSIYGTPPADPKLNFFSSRPVASEDPLLPEVTPVRLIEVADPAMAVTLGEVDLWIKMTNAPPGERPEIPPWRPLAVRVELIYLESSSLGERLAEYFDRWMTSADIGFLEQRLNAAGERFRTAASTLPGDVPPEARRIFLEASNGTFPLRPLAIQEAPIKTETEGPSGLVSLAGLIPLVLILMTITGAVYPAIDLTAGERERGTLELVIASPVPRLDVLVAKYAAVLIVAVLTATANLVCMASTIAVSGFGPILFENSVISLGAILQIIGLLVLFAAFFSGLLLALASVARSFKEAQVYVIPLMLVAMTPGFIALFPGIELQGLLCITPLLNVVLLSRDLIEGNGSFVALSIVAGSTLVYAVIALAIAARIFGAESVLNSTPGSLGDLFRRPRAPRASVPIPAVLLASTIAFPVQLLLQSAVARFGGEDTLTRVLLASAVQILLFIGLPTIVILTANVRIRNALGTKRPVSPLIFLSALLLGTSLWPLAHELILGLQQLGFGGFNESLLKRYQENIEQLRSISTVILILGFAILPALSEEYFFRGFVMRSLGTRLKPIGTIIASALLFGLFHLVTPTQIQLERFVTSSLLGLVLGLVAYRSQSLWPSMLLHATHNGLLMLLFAYQPELEALGFGVEEQDHLPITWLVASVVATVIGLFLTAFVKPRPKPSITPPPKE